MSKVKVCKTCGVPKRVGRGHLWNADGTMVQRQDRDHRMILFDSDGIDDLFKNIESLIGIPIENIVIESKARATEAYIAHLIKGPKGALARMIGIERVITTIVEQGRLLGYGDIRVTEFSWADAFMYCEITDPYSLPLFCGDLRGALQAIRKLEGQITYEEIGPNKYRIKDFQADDVTAFENRLLPASLPRKPGDITYHRCPGCNAPLEISGFAWDFDKGTITQKASGIRYAVFGSSGMQVVLDELEKELGDTVPATIVEAQRMHTAKTMNPRWKAVGQADIRNWLAVQGLGNLLKLEQKDSGYDVLVQNPAIPLLLVGTMAALFEFITDKKAAVEWSVADDGDLSMSVTEA